MQGRTLPETTINTRTSVQYYSLELNVDTYKKLLKKTIRLAKAKYKQSLDGGHQYGEVIARLL